MIKSVLSILSFFFCISISVTAQDQTVGTTIYDEDQAMEGYTFFSPGLSNTAYIVDNCGYVVNEWERGNRPGLASYFLENGLMLRTSKVSNPEYSQASTGGLVELVNWDNEIVWAHEFNEFEYIQHHDATLLPNGNLLIPGWERIGVAEQIAMGKRTDFLSDPYLWGEFIWEVKPIGVDDMEIVWEWHLQDHFVQDIDSSKESYGEIDENIGLVNINYLGPGAWDTDDWWHCNAIDYNPELDQIVLNSRNNNETWIIDHSTTTAEAASHEGGRSGHGGDLIYRWGNPQAYGRGGNSDLRMYGSHGHYFIEDGYLNAGEIMYFNNGDDRPQGYYSTIETINPTPDANGNYPLSADGTYLPEEPKLIYQAPDPDDFVSQYLSNARQLENGNVFINEGGTGRLFEVNSSGEIVWQYINPIGFFGTAAQGEAAVYNNNFRAYKLPADYPGFEGLDLTPQYILEGEEGMLCEPVSVVDNELSDINLIFNMDDKTITIINKEQLSLSLDIYSISGQNIKSQQASTALQISGNLIGLEHGIYIATITSQDGGIKSFKIAF